VSVCVHAPTVSLKTDVVGTFTDLPTLQGVAMTIGVSTSGVILRVMTKVVVMANYPVGAGVLPAKSVAVTVTV
jgi:hypothetical protein